MLKKLGFGKEATDRKISSNDPPLRQCPGCGRYARDEPGKCRWCTDVEFLITSADVVTDLRAEEERQQREVLGCWTAIRSKCEAAGVDYEDNSFPVVPSSVYYEWRRSPDVARVFDSPKPLDITRGQLSQTAWFLDALTLVAEKPALLERLILTKEPSAGGSYVLNLFKDGRWISVLIDDKFPYDQSNKPLYAKASTGQLWVSLLEKAAAKLCGGYQALNEAGNVLEGLAMLTGFPCKSVLLKRTGNQSVDRTFNDTVWSELWEFCKNGFLMMAKSNSAGSKTITQFGLRSNKNYTVVNVFFLNSQVVPPSRVVILRGEEFRKMSRDGDSSMGRATNNEIADGKMRMHFEDFLDCFDVLHVCRVRTDWMRVGVEGAMPRSSVEVTDLPIRRLNVAAKTKVDIALYQDSQKHKDGSDRNRMDLCIAVFQEGIGHDVENRVNFWDLVTFSERVTESSVSLSCELEPGAYLITCISIHPLIFDFEDTSFVLVLHSSGPLLPMRTLSCIGNAMCDALIRLALKKGKPPEPLEAELITGVNVYGLEIGFNGLLLMVENTLSKLITLNLDCTKSKDVSFTRESLLSKDYIPPNYRKIVAILTSKTSGETSKAVYKKTITAKEVDNKPPWEDSTSPPFKDRAKGLHFPRPIWFT